MTRFIRKTNLLMQFKEVNLPIGATYLCKRLDVPQATVGRMLTQMEKDGLLEKVGNKGRQLTAKGLAYLEKQCIIDSKKKVASSLISTVEDISKERLLEILDVRKLLECRAIEQACANVTSLEMKELDEIMLEYIYEVKQEMLRTPFRNLTHGFLRVRYGNFPASESLFEELAALQTQIRKGGDV